MQTNADKSGRRFDDPSFRQQVLKSAQGAAHRLGLPQSAAEDICQTVLWQLSRLPEEHLAQITDLRAYASRMVENEALNQLKQRHPHVPLDATREIAAGGSGSDQSAEARGVQSRILLKEIAARLSDEERALLRLLIFGYDAKEVAMRLGGISHDSARQRISRLRAKLRELIFQGQEGHA